MKKLISVLLTLVMVLSLCTVAFAAGVDPGTPEDVDPTKEEGNVWTNEYDVDFELNGGVTYVTDPVYCLEITWSYTYDDGASLEDAKYVWDTEQLKYVENTEENSGSISVPFVYAGIELKNKSNVPLVAKCSWEEYDEADFTIEEKSNDNAEEDGNVFYVRNLTAAAYASGDGVDNNAYDNYIDTTKTAAREDGKLVFKTPDESGYYGNSRAIGDEYSKNAWNARSGWSRTITVGPKSGVDYTGDYEKKLGTYTVTISLPSDDD